GDAATRVDGNSKGGTEELSVLGDLRGQVKLVTTLFGQRQADQAAGVPGHEIDDLRSDLLGSANEVAFILAIFVVNDDDHASVADVGDGFFDGRNSHAVMLTQKATEIIGHLLGVRRLDAALAKEVPW